ncbi:MAG TPA: tetratricopeptide repeat protein [Bauldia sp.]|nr:tetratricopeptide repeat protein [Bauldia sp.]
MPANADTAADLKLCLTAKDAYDQAIFDACDRFLDADGIRDADIVRAARADARLRAAKGDYSSALDDMDWVIELAPTKDAYLTRAFYLIQVGQYEEAIKDATTVIEKDSRNADAYYLRGRAHYLADDEDGGFADLSRAIKLAPKHGNAYLWRGMYNTDEFENDAAISDLTQALRYLRDSDPEFARANAFYRRGEAYYYDNRCQDALADVDEALKLTPKFAEVHQLRAECLDALKHWDDAIAEYGTVVELNPKNADAFSARGTLQVTVGHPEKALADYTHAIALNSAGSANYYLRGKTFRQLSKYDESIADLKVYIDKVPKAAVGQLELGRTYTAMGDAASAETAFRTGLDLADAAIAANPYPVSYFERGAIHYGLRQYQESIDDFTAAIRMTPDNVKFYYGRALTYEAMGDIEKAGVDRYKAQQIESGQPVDAEPADNTPGGTANDDDDDDGSWGVKGAGTIQKMH